MWRGGSAAAPGPGCPRSGPGVGGAPWGGANPAGGSREAPGDCETPRLPGRRGEGAAGRPGPGPASCAGAEHDVEPPDEDLPPHDLLPGEPDDAVRVAGLARLTAGVVSAEIRIGPEGDLGQERRGARGRRRQRSVGALPAAGA